MRKGSLADIHVVKVKSNSESDHDPLALFDEASPPRAPPVGSQAGLDVASKFGFMLESCILASRQTGVLVCPAHPEHPLSVEHIAPDLVSVLVCK